MRFPIRSSLAAAVLVLLGATASAQPAPHADAPPMPQGATPLARPAPPPPRPADGRNGTEQASTQTVNGRLQQWLVNPNGEVDGLLLADGTQVAFPPHLSAQVLPLFKTGDTVRVTGWRAANTPASTVVLRATGLANAAGRTVMDQPRSVGGQPPVPPAPRDPATLTAMSASGKVVRVLYTGRGDVNGVLLDGGSIVRFAPHVGAAMAPRLQAGSMVYARGWGSRGAQGSALEATAIGTSADNMQELFAGPGMTPPPPRPKAARGPAANRPVPAAPV